MKLQSLAIIFVIIILPISLVLSSYIGTRIETLSLQVNYDSKLNDATYDALKAYQLNSLVSDTSSYTNSKMRDINAAINTFFNTLSSGFGTLGYTKKSIQNFVPALVFTMYDGYYIYSPYTNTWDQETIDTHGNDPSYQGGENIYGLKPYVYYSCRYKRNNKFDVTITYSLDNYIQIQGYVIKDGKEKTVSVYGYLLGGDIQIVNDNHVIYKEGIDIKPENNILEERICYYDETNTFQNRVLPYIKREGTKYYTDGTKVFSVLNGNQVIQKSGITVNEVTNNKNAINYYKEAKKLYDFIMANNLGDLKTSDIVPQEGNEYYNISGNIFDWNNIESEDSNFNTHRIDVIKNAITRNLAIVINNFNNFSGVVTDFQMPKLRDEDWDKIMNNISVISFLQGVHIGGKIYNGYSIITNTKNEDIVMPQSIYILTKNDKIFHTVTEKGLSGQNYNNMIGIYNINIERRSVENDTGKIIYYFPAFPQDATLSYGSIVTQDNIAKPENMSIYDYLMKPENNNLRKVYFTALGRERYGLYRQKLEIMP